MLAVGIDVSKSKSTVAIIRSDGTVLSKPHDFSYYQRYYSTHSLNSFIPRKRQKVALESTDITTIPSLKLCLKQDSPYS